MSDTPASTEEPNSKPNKRKLADLLPAKAVVETSLGPLYVRHAYTSDWKHFDSDDSLELGRTVVRQLSSRTEDKKDSDPLAEEDLKALNDADFNALVPVIAKKNGWEEMPAEAGIKELGNAAKEGKEQQIELHKNMLRDMHKSIGLSYAFLDKGPLEKLQEQMAGLVDIRNGAMSSSLKTLKAAARASSLPSDELRRALGSTSILDKVIRDATLDGTLKGIEAAPARQVQLLMPPRPEDTLLGRATLESAENSRDAVQKMDALVEVVAGINQTLVKDLLPAWVRQVEASQNGATVAFNQAATGLKWTKWAVIASVVVTILVTWWQVSVARDIDRENSVQQKRVENILGEQLAAQQRLIDQQVRDSAAMREAISALKLPTTVEKAKK